MAGPLTVRPAFVPGPARGRTFVTSRTVRSTDVSPGGRLRFDATARYLQEAAEDDVADAGWAPPYDWLLRRCMITVRSYPARGDRVQLCTFCSATGPRWAERTTTLSGPGGDMIQARAVWVAIARATGEPVPLGPEFHRWYGESTGGRTVSARLSLPAPGTAMASPDGRDWPLRACDLDMAGHVNNSVHWAAVEDALAGLGWLPTVAELEYHREIVPGHRPRLHISRQPGQVLLWLLNGGERLASARLTTEPGPKTEPAPKVVQLTSGLGVSRTAGHPRQGLAARTAAGGNPVVAATTGCRPMAATITGYIGPAPARHQPRTGPVPAQYQPGCTRPPHTTHSWASPPGDQPPAGHRPPRQCA